MIRIYLKENLYIYIIDVNIEKEGISLDDCGELFSKGNLVILFLDNKLFRK